MKKNKWIYVSLFILTLGIVSVASTNSNIYKQVRESQSLINNVYQYLITHYVEDLDVEKFTSVSINNILMDLDPYTVYMEKEEKSGIELLTKGKYGGVGIQIGKREKQLTVISPMDNSPAKRMGILSGDVIVKIDSVEVETLSMDDAAKLIRGKKGTIVVLSIDRFGIDDLIEFPLTREEIKVKDVSYSGMIDEETGYIRLTRFSRNSARDMKKAIQKLMDSDMSGLVLDLRDNPGGLLNSAVDILDMFIDKKELLVQTKGRTKRSMRQYYAKNDPIVPAHLKIAVLINSGSASASEIVAGALQDFDRAVIVGRQSFGKGLVQTVYPLDKDRSLKITTAKYYIPSGRLIQKEGQIPDDLLLNVEDEDTLFYTIGGRKVVGGGGISPDYAIELAEASPLTSACFRRGVFFSFVQKNKQLYDNFDAVMNDNRLMDTFEYFVNEADLDIHLKGETPYLEARNSFMEMDSTNATFLEAIALLDGYYEDVSQNQFKEEVTVVRKWLLAEFAEKFDGKSGRFSVLSQKDNDIQKALEILADPVVYSEIFIPQ